MKVGQCLEKFLDLPEIFPLQLAFGCATMKHDVKTNDRATWTRGMSEMEGQA
jgi:hypothetical protein